ncbi:MAG: N-acetylmannosamine-6-phosphate 2-epimerase [Butyrivibrio sp.]|jgi:N-acylglucosamine-6-phosphate 2-epimerase|nr:N-acetylmannosamine-6-phosphate 2-epimerase [Butyrivibrio sp.]
MDKEEIFGKIRGGLIVSCQALDNEPLHGSEMMARMAFAAKEGGASGIRANTPEDILAIRQKVDLPVIGIIKAEYPDSEVYITPTMKEARELIAVHPEIIALDATDRLRPAGETLGHLFSELRKDYPDQLFMADCSCYEDGMRAQELGFDIVGTTLCSYTEKTRGMSIPNYDMIHRLTQDLKIPVIAEGGIWETGQLQRVYQERVLAVVIGTAITRPRDITRRFVQSIQK